MLVLLAFVADASLPSPQDDVTLTIQMPDYPSKPAWGCDGTSFTLEVGLSLLVGTLRDRIAVRFVSFVSAPSRAC